MLTLYTGAITKVHGQNHPEVFEVREVYEDLVSKAKHSAEDYQEEFDKLRQITDNYHIPDDVCETYTAVYQYLEEADYIYSEEKSN